MESHNGQRYESGIQSGDFASEYSESATFCWCKRLIHESRHCTFARDPSGMCLLKMAIELIVDLLAVTSCLILLQDQVIYFVMGSSFLLRKRRLLKQSFFTSHTMVLRKRRWQNRERRQFWVRPGRSSVWWDNLMNNLIVESEWKENFQNVQNDFLRPL